MLKAERRGRPAVVPALWLTLDASIAAAVAWPAQALLLFLLNPELPFTLGDFFSTMLALLPHALAVYVLAGPALVLLSTLLAVGRNTRRQLSVRYILRFAALDAALLAAAALVQYVTLGDLLPDLALSALGLTAISLAAAAAVAFGLALYDLRRPRVIGAPWAVALGLGVALPLTLAGDMRRVRTPDPVPVVLPGFAPERGSLLVEIPGLDPRDVDLYVARGNAPVLGSLLARGAFFRVEAGPAVDPIAAHVTLVTGRPPRAHGVLAAARFRPAVGDISFGVFPRGLLLRPLLLTPLWRRVPVDARDVRAVALPGMAEGLGLPLALVGDPLGWHREATGAQGAPPGALTIARHLLRPDVTLHLGAAGSLPCPRPEPIPFALPAASLPGTPALTELVREALAEDLCALAAARALLLGPDPPPLVAVRLAGHGRVAWQFAGWREEDPARSAGEDEISAYRFTLTRYARELDAALEPLFEAAGPERLVGVVAPLGVSARQDLGGLGLALLGRDTRTGTFAGPPPGFAVLAGPGVRPGRRLAERQPLTAVLPTLLWAQGLPAAEDMGPLVRGAFTPAFAEAHPVIALPSYAAAAAAGR